MVDAVESNGRNDVSFLVLLGLFVLGFIIGGIGGIVLGFAWYEHKCGLFSDHSGRRMRAIRYTLEDLC